MSEEKLTPGDIGGLNANIDLRMSEKMMCDICGGPCFHQCDKDDPDSISHEFATIEAHWGYYSNKDLFHDKTHVCEKCYDEIMEYIVKKMHGKPKRFTYDPWPQQRTRALRGEDIFEFVDCKEWPFLLEEDRPKWPEHKEPHDEEDICM